MSEDIVDLHLIARLESDVAVADIFCCEVFYDTRDGSETGRRIRSWWESVSTEPGRVVALDVLDEYLYINGYIRDSDWRQQVTASGAVRYFAEAFTHLENLDL
ncbi:hypothetical protein ACWDUL_28210 [Nocardia niigatensis]